jgi:hypothetical protein
VDRFALGLLPQVLVPIEDGVDYLEKRAAMGLGELRIIADPLAQLISRLR